MAHVYTTARGKTKKAKETQRKDAKNNAANKLMSKVVKTSKVAQSSVPIDLDLINKLRSADANGMKTLHGTGNSKVFKPQPADGVVSDDALAKAIRAVRVQLPSFNRCFYALCASPSETATYKHCSRCRVARYCSADCQKADWPRIHKYTCGKPESLTIGSSVAVMPVDTYLSIVSSHYSPLSCKPPCNEIHGIISSIQSYSATESGVPTVVDIEVFDSNLIPTKTSVSAVVGDVILSGWELDVERELATQKEKDMEEAKKRAEDRKVMLEEEERVYQAKKRAKEERVKVLMEKKKKEMEAQSGSVSVDWSLFETELMDTLEDLPEDDE